MALAKGTLIRDQVTAVTYRVLDEVASTETKDSATTHYVVINVNDHRAVPEFIGKLKTLERLADPDRKTRIAVVPEDREPVNLKNLSKAESKRVQARWKLIQSLTVHGARLYEDRYRGALAADLAANKVASKPYFYMALRLYWQRGGGQESLLTDLPKCGRKGVKRIPRPNDPKPGRPRTIQPGHGVAATKHHRANMRLAWAHSPVGKNGRGLKAAWTWMLITKYSEHVKVLPGDEVTVQIENYDAVPTFEQFRYHYREEFSFAVRALNRMQRRKFDLAFKPLLTGTLAGVGGPGYRYYIDATVLDVYAVSRLNRNRIIGRPTLYLVIDEFSRLIVGMYIGLEPPCWAGAMLALWNCSIDKVAFCAQYGIDIPADIWPTGGIPLHLMGDRGELSSRDAERLSQGFSLDVENARPYAGEAKGPVERPFGILQGKFGPYMPGYVDKDFAGRDAEPAALRAAMDIHQITTAMILSVLHTNLRVVREYDGLPEVVASGTPFVPIELWRWGVENLRYDARRFSDLTLKRYLWPEGTAKLTRRALAFQRGLYYMGVGMQQSPWFAQSHIKRDTLDILYHPGSIDKAIVLPPAAREGVLDVELTPRSKRFGDVALSEVVALSRQSRQQDAAATWRHLSRQTSFEEQMHSVIKEARKQSAKEADAARSKAGRLKGIKENRASEIEHMNSEAQIGSTGVDNTGRVIDVKATVVDEPTPSTLDAVKQLIQMRQTGPKA